MSDEFNPLNVDSEDWRYWKPYGKPFRDKIPELERTDMDKMRAQAIADADDLTALAERSAVDEREAFELQVQQLRKHSFNGDMDDADIAEKQILDMWQARAQQAPAEAVQPYPEGNVVGPCICGSWPGGKCFKCPRIEAGAAQQVPEGVALVERPANFKFTEEGIKQAMIAGSLARKTPAAKGKK